MRDTGSAGAAQLVFIFDSIHYVLKAEKALKKEGVSCELVPVPREISSDCGMAVAIDESTGDLARRALAGQSLSYSIFCRKGRGYFKIP